MKLLFTYQFFKRFQSIAFLSIVIFSIFFLDLKGQELHEGNIDLSEIETPVREVYSPVIYRDIKHESYSFFKKGHDKRQIVIYIPTTKNRKRAFSNSMVVLGASLAGMGILYTMPESFTNWTDEDRKLTNITSKWRNNVREGPVIDKDNIFLNWIMHPYFGAVYYQSMRGSGYGMGVSFLFSAAASSLYWEYGVEALAEVPSLQDLIITPVVGSLLGEGFHWARKKIKYADDRVLGSLVLGRTSLFLLDPLNEVHDIFLRRKIKRKYDQKAQLSSFIIPQNKGVAFGVNLSF